MAWQMLRSSTLAWFVTAMRGVCPLQCNSVYSSYITMSEQTSADKIWAQWCNRTAGMHCILQIRKKGRRETMFSTTPRHLNTVCVNESTAERPDRTLRHHPVNFAKAVFCCTLVWSFGNTRISYIAFRFALEAQRISICRERHGSQRSELAQKSPFLELLLFVPFIHCS